MRPPSAGAHVSGIDLDAHGLANEVDSQHEPGVAALSHESTAHAL
jgi:hypothetical protein